MTEAASRIAHIGGLERRNQAQPNNNRGYYRTTLLNQDLDASGERGVTVSGQLFRGKGSAAAPISADLRAETRLATTAIAAVIE